MDCSASQDESHFKQHGQYQYHPNRNGRTLQTQRCHFSNHPEGCFQTVLDEQTSAPEGGVQVANIIEDQKPFIEKYDPGHPDADENGYIRLPNVNIVEEMVNMISASRSFEANATAVRNTKDMASAALEIGKS
ncbi:flagellar basal body rod protein FlgC [Desulfosarcina cetonica]|uniref:flagellar basal body rod protein FlgC n=1 Tax=Desulfosarcina cetonica TaxID=90730 RepID=UPI001FEEE40E|nr:flagellar basal body rod protein FlgC [Desulfosarcina cetonica]